VLGPFYLFLVTPLTRLSYPLLQKHTYMQLPVDVLPQ
jgi:hypothetical protein